MKTSVMDISLERLALAYLLGLIVFILMNLKKLSLNKHLLIGVIRMSIQLSIVGFLLKYIFKYGLIYPYLLAAIFIFMSYNAATIVIKRTGISFPYSRSLVFAGIALGPGLVLLFFVYILVHPKPWYAPQYFIPIAGMILGNSMNGSALALERFFEECRKSLPSMKTLISLGASSKQASEEAFRMAYRAALLPTLTSISSLGIVSLPGMMTGQILGGSEPTVAIKYQIAIMLAILASVSITALVILSLEQRALFNQYGLPKEDLLK